MPMRTLLRDGQRQSVAHVLQPHAAGNVGDVAQLAAEGHAAKVFRRAAPGAGEPDLIARRRPGNSLNRKPARSEFLLFAIGADHGHRTLIVADGVLVVGERHRLAVGRNLGIADPVDAVEQHLARWDTQVASGGSRGQSGRPRGCRRWATNRRPARSPGLRAACRRSAEPVPACRRGHSRVRPTVSRRMASSPLLEIASSSASLKPNSREPCSSVRAR